MKNSLSCTRVSLMLMSMFFVINSHFTKIALLGLTHFFGAIFRKISNKQQYYE